IPTSGHAPVTVCRRLARDVLHSYRDLITAEAAAILAGWRGTIRYQPEILFLEEEIAFRPAFAVEFKSVKVSTSTTPMHNVTGFQPAPETTATTAMLIATFEIEYDLL